MNDSRNPRFLHVANGTSTTGIIKAAGIPGTLSIWADPLHDGPVPGGLSDDELLEVRARHLAEPAGDSYRRNLDGLRGWRRAIEDQQSYDELVLWYEHDLFDQLNLIQILTEIRRRLPAHKTVSLVCIGSFPGRPRFKGLGELTPKELAPLLETRQPVTDAQYTLAEHAWRAFRRATPEALDDLRRSDTRELRYLGAAATRFLQEYPWASGGLSRSERRLLQLAARAPIDAAAAFPRMHDDEDAYYITDTSLVDLIDALSAPACPLITVTDNGVAARSPLRRGTIALTDVGREILSAGRDRVAICGLDRWMGGVHLQSGVAMWRWDPSLGRITRS